MDQTGALQRRRLLAGISIAAVLIAANWVLYVTVVTAGHTSEAALGYFLNPLVTVGLGVIVLGERLRVLQWVAVGIGLVAGVYLTIPVAGCPTPRWPWPCRSGSTASPRRRSARRFRRSTA